MSLTCLPCRVSQWMRVLGPYLIHRHQLEFSWLLVLHLVYGERGNLKALARPFAPRLPALSSLVVRDLLAHEDVAVVVCRPSIASLPPT